MLDTHVRWLIRRDMPQVLAIENASFEYPWREDEFYKSLRQRNCIGMVAQEEPLNSGDPIVLGFMIYELHKDQLHLLNFAVAPSARRRGVGRSMLNKLKGKLSDNRRHRIVCEIRESNLPAQRFFQCHGFRCISVIRDFYEDPTEDDAYVFAYRIDVPKPYCAANRLMTEADQ